MACLLMATTGWCKPGDLLWESLQPSDSNGTAYAVGAEGNVVVATGEGGANCSPFMLASCNWLVRAFDAETGTTLWKDKPETADSIRRATAVAVRDGSVFVAGDVIGAGAETSGNVGFNFLVRAFDKRTGAPVWTDQVHRQARGQATRVRFKDGKLFAYGWDCDETVFNCHGDVRTYDAKTGTLQWESRFTGPGGDSLVPTTAFAVHGDQVFIGNGLLDEQQDQYKWIVRSYDATDGSIRWQNKSDDKGYRNSPFALKASNGRLLAAGSTNRSDGSYVFTVRAYSAPTSDDSGCDDE